MEAQMKINGEAVRALREQKSWSQEHLANASGLSVRTVQRVELEGIASAETRLALAAALWVPVADLMPAPPSPNAPVVDGDPSPFGADWRLRPQGATLMGKTLRAFGFGIVLAFALLMLLVVLFNALSGFLPRN
jgi:transcriptional regulator with XRE-family HTH domain